MALPVWDVEAIYHFLGDSRGVRQTCIAAIPDRKEAWPSRSVVAVWKSRNRISYEWLPVLVRACLARGVTNLFLDDAAPPVPSVKPDTDQTAADEELAALGL